MADAALKLDQQKSANCEIHRSEFSNDVNGLIKLSSFLSRVLQKVITPDRDLFLNRRYFSPKFTDENPFPVFQIDPNSTTPRKELKENTEILSLYDVGTLVRSCVLDINYKHFRYFKPENTYASQAAIDQLLFDTNTAAIYNDKGLLEERIKRVLLIIDELEKLEIAAAQEQRQKKAAEQPTEEESATLEQKVNKKIEGAEGIEASEQTQTPEKELSIDEMLTRSSELRNVIERQASLLQITALPQLLAGHGLAGLNLETFAQDYPVEYQQIRYQIRQELESMMRNLDPKDLQKLLSGEIDPITWHLKEVRVRFLMTSNPKLEGTLQLLEKTVVQQYPTEQQPEIEKQIVEAKKVPIDLNHVSEEEEKQIKNWFAESKDDLQKLSANKSFETNIDSNLTRLLEQAGVSPTDQKRIFNTLSAAWAKDLPIDFLENISPARFQAVFGFNLPEELASKERFSQFLGSLKHWRIVHQNDASNAWKKDSLRQSGTQELPDSETGKKSELTDAQIRQLRETESLAERLGVTVDDISIARSLNETDLAALQQADAEKVRRINEELLRQKQEQFQERVDASGEIDELIRHPEKILEIYTRPLPTNVVIMVQPATPEVLEERSNFLELGKDYVRSIYEQLNKNHSDRDIENGNVTFSFGADQNEIGIESSPGIDVIANAMGGVSDTDAQAALATGAVGANGNLLTQVGGKLAQRFIANKAAMALGTTALKTVALTSTGPLGPLLAAWTALPNELKMLPLAVLGGMIALAGKLISAIMSIAGLTGLGALTGGLIGAFTPAGPVVGALIGGGAGFGADAVARLGSGGGAGSGGGNGGNILSGLFRGGVGTGGAASVGNLTPFINPTMLAATGTVAGVGLVVLGTLSNAFLAPLPTITAGGEISPYVTLTKSASPAQTGAKFDNPAELTPQKITYSISIAPKPGYKLTVHDLTDTFSFSGNISKRTNEKDPANFPPAATPVNFQLLQSTVGQTSSDVVLTEQNQVQLAPYDETFNKTYHDSNVTNTVQLKFDVVPIDASGNPTGDVIKDQTATTAEVICFGECPQSQNGCWPVSGVIIQSPYGTYSHQIIEAADIKAVDGTVAYATYDGNACYYPYGNTGVYGNYIDLTTDTGFHLWYGHLLKSSDARGTRVCWPVKHGDPIAYTDSTSKEKNFRNPHLHYELRDNNNTIPLCAHGGCIPDPRSENGYSAAASVIPTIPFQETLQSKVPDKIVDQEFVRSCYDKPGNTN